MAKKKRPQRQKAGYQRLTKRSADALKEQREAFKRKFGRDPGPGDPVFFDPDEDEPVKMDLRKSMAMTVITMIQSDTPLHLIYAYVRTDGMIIGEDKVHLWSEEDLAEWEHAMWEFDRHFADDS